MTPMDRDEALAECHRVKRLRARAAAAQKAATEATDPAIEQALRAGIGASEIAEAIGVSDGYVRSVRRTRKLPANPSYAGNKPPGRSKANPAD